jgi:outer membrane protein assembly factor BamD (BamD/ComL family)
MLLAEIAQGAGKPELAVERYIAVADTFRGTAAAESALYAAARVELKRRDTAAARTLLDRYLARHPTGRYAEDARRELAGLH